MHFLGNRRSQLYEGENEFDSSGRKTLEYFAESAGRRQTLWFWHFGSFDEFGGENRQRRLQTVHASGADRRRLQGCVRSSGGRVEFGDHVGEIRIHKNECILLFKKIFLGGNREWHSSLRKMEDSVWAAKTGGSGASAASGPRTRLFGSISRLCCLVVNLDKNIILFIRRFSV